MKIDVSVCSCVKDFLPSNDRLNDCGRHYILIRFLNLPKEAAILDWFSVLLEYMYKNKVDISGPN